MPYGENGKNPLGCAEKNFTIDFIGIGASKAGTTWINEMLNSHPEICMSEPKEVNFFNERESYYINTENNNYAKGLDWYQKHFLHCGGGKVMGEICPKYLHDLKAPERIKKLFPDVKLIACLRNPLDRAFSQYNFIKYFFNKEERPFEEVIRMEREYVEKGLYCKHLNKYLRFFDPSRMHIIWFEDIQTHPDDVLYNLFRFLGVAETFSPSNPYQKINAARQSRFHHLPLLMKKFSGTLTRYRLSFIVEAIKKTGAHTLIKKANARKIDILPMPEDARRFLGGQFSEDIAGLEKLLNKDLSHWK